MSQTATPHLVTGACRVPKPLRHSSPADPASGHPQTHLEISAKSRLLGFTPSVSSWTAVYFELRIAPTRWALHKSESEMAACSVTTKRVHRESGHLSASRRSDLCRTVGSYRSRREGELGDKFCLSPRPQAAAPLPASRHRARWRG